MRDALATLTDEGWIRCNGASRRRQVSGVPGEKDKGTLSSSIVLLTTFSFDPYHLHRQAGWSEYIDKGAASAIHEKGFHLLSFHLQRVESEWNQMLSHKPGGVLVTDLFHHIDQIMSFLPPFSPQAIPVVAYGDSVAASQYDRVTSDHEKGGYALTKALIERGCRRPLMLDAGMANASYWFTERRRGFERALVEAGLPVTPLVLTENVSLLPAHAADSPESENDFALRARLLSSFLIPHLTGVNRVDAVLATADEHVPLAMRACRLFGLEPNRDILVAGYDNCWFDVSDRTYEPIPPLFTVDKHNEQMGKQMFELLEQRKNRQLEATPYREVVVPSLVEIKAE